MIKKDGHLFDKLPQYKSVTVVKRVVSFFNHFFFVIIVLDLLLCCEGLKGSRMSFPNRPLCCGFSLSASGNSISSLQTSCEHGSLLCGGSLLSAPPSLAVLLLYAGPQNKPSPPSYLQYPELPLSLSSRTSCDILLLFPCICLILRVNHTKHLKAHRVVMLAHHSLLV